MGVEYLGVIIYLQANVIVHKKCTYVHKPAFPGSMPVAVVAAYALSRAHLHVIIYL